MKSGSCYLNIRNPHHDDAVAVVRAIYELGGTATSKQIRDKTGLENRNGIMASLHQYGVVTRRIGPHNIRTWTLVWGYDALVREGVLE